MRRATEADRDAILAFLTPRAPRSMFLLVNLADHGFGRGHRNALRLWIPKAGSAVTGVLGLTEGGTVLPQIAPEHVAAAARALDGERVQMMLGPAEQVRPLKEALGLGGAPCRKDADEPQFLLDLARLRMPEGPGALVPLGQVDRDLIVGWRAAYDVEAFDSPPEEARARALGEIEEWIAADSHRALIVGGRPVAMTGFNARLPDIVQVGGVWTPPDLRRRGHASRAVALHLAEARAAGVTRATLFAASAAAARIYMALGFRPIGHYTLCLLDGARTIDV